VSALRRINQRTTGATVADLIPTPSGDPIERSVCEIVAIFKADPRESTLVSAVTARLSRGRKHNEIILKLSELLMPAAVCDDAELPEISQEQAPAYIKETVEQVMRLAKDWHADHPSR
jgi:hypothetical protein